MAAAVPCAPSTELPIPSISQLTQEAQWRSWQRDPERFIDEACFIWHPRDGRIPFVMRDAQRETLRAFEQHDRVIILKARQIGFTTLIANYALWCSVFRADHKILLLSRTEKLAIDFLDMAKYAWRLLPEWVKQRAPVLQTNTQTAMVWANGSEIESLPSQSDPARGRTASLVVVDEWASLENPEAAWASIAPTADIGGRVIGLSTAKGWGDFFHDMWSKARTGNSRFFPIFYPWSAVPERDDRWFKEQTAELLPWIRAQEYCENEDEAFIKSGNPVFDVDQIQQWEFDDPKLGYLWHGGGLREFRPSTSGELAIWQLPDRSLQDRYVIGADVAEGLGHGDYSSAHVISVLTGNVVAHWHGHIDPDEFGVALSQLGWFYGTALVGVEENGHGLTTLVELRRVGYKRLYYRRIRDDRQPNKLTSKIGWKTTRSTKPLMIDELAKAIRRDEDGVADLRVPCEKTAAELRRYVRDEKGGTNGSPFDDRVISLAIAQQMRAHVLAPEYQEKKSHYWTMAWWAEQGRDEEGSDVIGLWNTRGNESLYQ